MKTLFLWSICRSKCLGWEKWSLALITPGRGALSSIVKSLAHESNGPVRPRPDERWYEGVYRLCFEVVICMPEFVPDGLQNGSKGGDPNSCSNQHSHFILKNILTDSAKGTIHLNPGRRHKAIGKWSLTSTPNLKHPPRDIAAPMADFSLFCFIIIIIIFYCNKHKVQWGIVFSYLPVCILVWVSAAL